MTPTKDENGKAKEIKNLERRLDDERIDNVNDKLSDHETRLKKSEDIVSSWKSERKTFLYVISGMGTFITVVVVGIFLTISALRTEMSTHNISQATEIATLQGDINRIDGNVDHLKETMKSDVKNLNEKIELKSMLSEIKDRIK